MHNNYLREQNAVQQQVPFPGYTFGSELNPESPTAYDSDSFDCERVVQ